MYFYFDSTNITHYILHYCTDSFYPDHEASNCPSVPLRTCKNPLDCEVLACQYFPSNRSPAYQLQPTVPNAQIFICSPVKKYCVLPLGSDLSRTFRPSRSTAERRVLPTRYTSGAGRCTCGWTREAVGGSSCATGQAEE